MKCAELVMFAETAADLVLEGWCQHEDCDEYGNVCGHGAATKSVFGTHYPLLYLDPCCGMSHEEFEECQAARRELVLVAQDWLFTEGYGYISLGEWNDAEGRTAAQVADMWRHVAKEIANNSTEYPL